MVFICGKAHAYSRARDQTERVSTPTPHQPNPTRLHRSKPARNVWHCDNGEFMDVIGLIIGRKARHAAPEDDRPVRMVPDGYNSFRIIYDD